MSWTRALDETHIRMYTHCLAYYASCIDLSLLSHSLSLPFSHSFPFSGLDIHVHLTMDVAHMRNLHMSVILYAVRFKESKLNFFIFFFHYRLHYQYNDLNSWNFNAISYFMRHLHYLFVCTVLASVSISGYECFKNKI